MEIEWAIIAKDYQLNLDKTLDIYGIIDDLVIYKRNGIGSFFIIMKLRFNPIESGKTKTINLKIVHNTKGVIKNVDTPYKVPDWDTAINEITYLISSLKAVRIVYEGIYTFKISVDGEYKNEVSVDARYASKGETV